MKKEMKRKKQELLNDPWVRDEYIVNPVFRKCMNDFLHRKKKKLMLPTNGIWDEKPIIAQW